MRIAELLAEHRPTHGRRRRPYLIAEAGVNHEGSMATARRMVEEAAAAGADAIKFQTYRAETLAARESPAYWDTSKEPTKSQYELFKRHDSFWRDEFEQLRRHCDEAGIEFLSTPFDLESATFLNDLVEAFKISSSDLTNRPFIEFIRDFGKPILLSTGASTISEIADAVELIRDGGNPTCLMHCILSYPAHDSDANLGMIVDLARRFPDAVPGYSDHTLPNPEMDVLTTATLLGAAVLEKHFTLDKTLPGNDHYHAMDPDDVRRFRERLERLDLLIGSDAKRPLPAEEAARANARRSLVARHRIAAGTSIADDDLTWKRPGTGISPRHVAEVVGRRARHDIAEDQLLDWGMIE